MKLSDFDFNLPPELIALRPALPRDSSRLLVAYPAAQTIEDDIFANLPNQLRRGDVLVFNSSKTIRAALNGVRPARDANSPIVNVAINLHKSVNELTWRAFAKPAKRLRIGDELIFDDNFKALIIEKYDGGEVILEFNCLKGEFFNQLEKHGQMPIPPYIGQKRRVDSRDDDDYQTIYANQNGSVATPTAGLHFTDVIMKSLDEIGVERHILTLHVGAGTFLPVKVDDITKHKMHEEYFEIAAKTAAALNKAKAEGRRIICVGTTSLRAIESSLNAGRQVSILCGNTDIFLYPGKKIHFADGLISNFHLPKSTLLMLLSAFCGTQFVKMAYQHAIEKCYRFFSYGDTGLWWRADIMEP